MRRIRREATKVWHNPEIQTGASRPRTQPSGAKPQAAEDRRSQSQHRAALEALFSPKPQPGAADADDRRGGASRETTPKPGGRIVLAPPPQSDPKAVERQRLLSKFSSAQGRPEITKAAREFLKAGFTFPNEQDIYLQLLEHTDEQEVRSAIGALQSVLLGELPKRRAVLESRLRRIEEFADDPETRDAAESLRKLVSGRADLKSL